MQGASASPLSMHLKVRRRPPKSFKQISAKMTHTKFAGLKLLFWLSLIVRFDFILMEKPPKFVKEQNIKERLKHSTVVADEINNVHFTSRGKVVGSSGKT